MRKIVQPVQKTENADVVAASPLAATGVEKMILVIRDKQVLLDCDLHCRQKGLALRPLCLH